MRDLTRYNAKYPAHLMSKDKKRESDNPPRWYKYGSHHPRKAWTLYLGRIIGGQLNDCEDGLITTRGSKTKRSLVKRPTLLASSVEVEPEYFQLL